jgi:hypothetical protein
MEDEHLGRLLRELPREKARPGFTTRVAARLDQAPPARVRWVPRLAAALLAVTVATAGWVQHQHAEAARAARMARASQLLRELRAQHGQIKRELESLPAEPPVLYLGGNEDMDLVVDLREVRDPGGVQPADYRVDTF